MTEKSNPSPQLLTFAVAGLVCALLYYIYKDVNRQVETIRAEAAAAQTDAAPIKQSGPLAVACPDSRYEGKQLFSQYYEDYILDFVFQDVGKGVYLDVGAAEPTRFSLTHNFYLKGWRGINIDPVPSYKKLYEQQRPGDLFLNIGISNEAGNLLFYECGEGCGLSTFDKAGAKKLAKEFGFKFEESFREIKVPVVPLRQVLKDHPRSEIHFANIDVEGWEKQVLESFDFNQVRPEVFVVESTAPMSTSQTQLLWEHILIENGYVLAMTDFINRFYVDRKSKKLTQHLERFSTVDLCVRRSKIKRGLIPTSYKDWFRPKPKSNPPR